MAADAALWTLHAAVTILLTVHSAEYLRLALLRARVPRPTGARAPPVPPDPPELLVQVPVCGDAEELPGLAQALAALDWPRFHVQLLDDSDDAGPGAAFVARLQRAGVTATHVRRGDRTGAKAGALAHGMRLHDAPYLVPMDVDARPEPDLLRHLIAPMADPKVGCVQPRWSIRPSHGALAWAQRLALAGHFHVEQTVRAQRGGLMSFNATACAWRREAVDAAGGWSGDTVTEDLDLAARALLRGSRFVYLEHVAVPTGVPTRFSAFVLQQARWARGSMQCARRHAGAMARQGKGWGTLFHLVHYSLHPLLVLLFAAQGALAWAVDAPAWYAWSAIGLLLAGPVAMYFVAWRKGPDLRLRDTGAILPLTLYGLAATPRLAWDAIAGLTRAPAVFRGTPKGGRRAPWRTHGPPAAAVAVFVAVWWWLAWPLGDPLAPGVAAFGACCAWGALAR